MRPAYTPRSWRPEAEVSGFNGVTIPLVWRNRKTDGTILGLDLSIIRA